ncbi:MAG TPA: type II secretion system F family protein [Tepidisphaeraceae bacterium]|nr:type II secretion system F family protein [Tepidisphaeraceae bacterium]
MSVFAYTALSKDGSKTSGTLSAETRAAAIAQMSRQGLSPVRIDEARDAAAAAKKAAAAKAGAGGPVGKVSNKAVESFTRELANLLAGGVPLSRAMSLLRREASNPAAKALWNSIYEDIVGGTALADALAKYPKNFSKVYVAMVRAGEAGGFLDVVLGQISDFRTREQDLMGKVKAAMVYPIVLVVLAVGVLIFLLSYFIPQFSGIFKQFGSNLPTLTLVIIAISNVVKHYILYVLAAAIIIGVVFKRAIQTQSGRRQVELTVLSTPLLGNVIAHFALVRFTRMLGTLVGAGVSLIASLRVAREAIGNQTLADTVSTAIDEVQRGQALSKSLASSPRLFPPSVIEMIAVAEETGRLDKELLRIATTYESDLDRQLRLLVAVGEPVLLFMMAAMIGTIVIGMLLPILNLSDVVK